MEHDKKSEEQTNSAPKIPSPNLQKLKKNCLSFLSLMIMMSWHKKWPICSMKTA
jgi:hypothetical protein